MEKLTANGHDPVAESLQESLIKEIQHPFPIDVFSPEIQQIIKGLEKNSNFIPDYTAAGILFTASIIIGKQIPVATFNGEYRAVPILWLCCVGNSGVGKSQPVKYIINYLNRKDDKEYQEFQLKLAEWNQLSVKEKKTQKMPQWYGKIIYDTTPEALTEALNNDMYGIGIYVDELAGWIDNFNRYNKSGEESAYLSLFDGSTFKVIRKTQYTRYVKDPFASIIGTIQPDILKRLFRQKISNGFAPRFLYFYPENQQAKEWANYNSKSYKEDWFAECKKMDDYVAAYVRENALLSQQGSVKALSFTREAETILRAWQKNIAIKNDQADRDEIKAYYAKLETYCFRLALVLNVLGEKNLKVISGQTAENTVKLLEYFEYSGLKVMDLITDENPISQLKPEQSKFYAALPDKFTTNEAIECGKQTGIYGAAGVKKFLRKHANLFDKLRHGEYIKKI